MSCHILKQQIPVALWLSRSSQVQVKHTKKIYSQPQNTQKITIFAKDGEDKVNILPNLVMFYAYLLLNYSEDFETISQSILLEKLAAHGMDDCTRCWIKSGLMARPKEW